jgi:DNA-binding LacI/PurR family transcriptional regulator
MGTPERSPRLDRQPVERMARALTLTLLDRIANPESPVTAQIYPPRLVVRESG